MSREALQSVFLQGADSIIRCSRVWHENVALTGLFNRGSKCPSTYERMTWTDVGLNWRNDHNREWGGRRGWVGWGGIRRNECATFPSLARVTTTNSPYFPSRWNTRAEITLTLWMKKESPSETLLSFIHSDRLEQGEGRLRRNISENYRGRKKEKGKENYEKRWSLIVRTFSPSGFFARQCSSIGPFSILCISIEVRETRKETKKRLGLVGSNDRFFLSLASSRSPRAKRSEWTRSGYRIRMWRRGVLPRRHASRYLANKILHPEIVESSCDTRTTRSDFNAVSGPRRYRTRSLRKRCFEESKFSVCSFCRRSNVAGARSARCTCATISFNARIRFSRDSLFHRWRKLARKANRNLCEIDLCEIYEGIGTSELALLTLALTTKLIAATRLDRVIA